MIEAKTAQGLLDQIADLEHAITTAGNDARQKLADFRLADLRAAVPRQTNGTLDATAWVALTDADRESLYERLRNARDALHGAAQLDGPTDPMHVMYGAYAATWAILVWVAGGFVLVAALLTVIINKWDRATDLGVPAAVTAATSKLDDLEKIRKQMIEAEGRTAPLQVQLAEAKDDKRRLEAQNTLDENNAKVTSLNTARKAAELKAREEVWEAVSKSRDGGPSESQVLAMVCLLGALGGSLHYLASVVKFVGNRQLKRSWLLYYLSLPFVGAALAPIVYMLLRIGILTPSGPTSSGATSNLNLLGIYAFAALTGMFAKTATDKLGEVFGTLFRTEHPPLKDSLKGEKPTAAEPRQP